ncbi:hypothetical protein SBF1_1300013 [Candidatus Desulfosporosinus infrequens]|uniref:Uncharacterized protein n=1 Tax=Candidatus Desulfosporosinus infrequens TaxID=2043169 RepID=A0A2U3K464_9FIRM|nr:hypothetical protein SBF1_1300013 [Candidatus Desulfosporosinus infrequens]
MIGVFGLKEKETLKNLLLHLIQDRQIHKCKYLANDLGAIFRYA